MSNSVPVGLDRVSTQYQTKVYNKQSSICIDCSMTCMNCIQHKSTLFPCKECKVAPSVPCVAPPRGSKSKCLYCKLNSEPFVVKRQHLRSLRKFCAAEMCLSLLQFLSRCSHRRYVQLAHITPAAASDGRRPSCFREASPGCFSGQILSAHT